MKTREVEPTLSSSIAQKLRELIINGDLEPGSRINIDALKSQLGVSLSPLREALSRLASEGYLTFLDKRGYRVSQVSESDLQQIILLRLDLETLALRYAIEYADLDWEKSLTDKLNDLVGTQRNNSDPVSVERWERAHLDFHTELLSTCGMPLLLQFTTTLHLMCDRYRRIFLATRTTEARDTNAEHVAIAEAAIARDKELAVRLLKAHIEATGAHIRKALPRVLRRQAWEI